MKVLLCTLLALLPLAASAQDAVLQPVRVGSSTIDLYAEAFYAQELGLFKKEGLDVTITTMKNAGAVAPAVLGGAIDIGVGDPVQIAEAYTENVPLSIIAGGGLYSSNAAATVLCVAKNSPLRTVKDLAGKTISVPTLSDTAQVGVLTWLEQNGVDPASVKFVEVGNPVAGAAVASGRVDAAMIPEPFRTTAMASEVRVFAKPFDAIGTTFFIGVWYGKKDWVAAHPGIAQKFARAIYAAGRWANAHHMESAEILAKHSKTNLAVLQKMQRAPYAESMPVD